MNALRSVAVGGETGIEAKVPGEWILAASRGQSMDLLQQLFLYGNQQDVDRCLSEVVLKGNADVVLLLAKYSSNDAVSNAVTQAFEHGHFELAITLVRLYRPDQSVTLNMLLASVEREDLNVIHELVSLVAKNSIDIAMTTAARDGKFEAVKVLVERASSRAIVKAAEAMIGRESAGTAFAKALTCLSPEFLGTFSGKTSLKTLFGKASRAGDHRAIQALLPFMTNAI